jgi:SSS family solute:Na+ symporter
MALIIMPEQAAQLIEEDPQKVLPTLVMTQMPFVMQVLFFGALLSAIKSCASATLLAPSVTFTENIWRQFFPHQGDKQSLLAMRVTVLVFSALVLLYAIQMQGSVDLLLDLPGNCDMIVEPYVTSYRSAIKKVSAIISISLT